MFDSERQSHCAVQCLVKQLDEEPRVTVPPGIALRCYRGDAVRDVWLSIHSQAFADLQRGARPWNRDDFEREFVGKPWWSNESILFAEMGYESRLVGQDTILSHPFDDESASAGQDSILGYDRCAVGTVCVYAVPDQPDWTINWLAVLPAYRRRGIGRALVQGAERRVWHAGGRTIRLQTLGHWHAAVALYRSLGYAATGNLKHEI